MKFFDIPTITQAIERLHNFSANWLLPAFVFAANDVGVGSLVDMSKRAGTDQFLDRFFHGNLISLPPMAHGNNLLRPRLKGITWDRGPYAGDHIIRQDTKMWGNLFSSRGYREMRLQGLIVGEKAITGLTEAFQDRFEQEIPENFRFEDFLVWLFAFKGFPDKVTGWPDLMTHLLEELGLQRFKPPYCGRFKLTDPPMPWPNPSTQRPTDVQFLERLAPKLAAELQGAVTNPAVEVVVADSELSTDDAVFAAITMAVQSGESLAFLLAGPPGTGKTTYARRLAQALTGRDASCMLFLQFHPAIGYDDFIEGFRPVQAANGTGVTYELGSRVFLKFSAEALRKPDKTFVVVIDEINRGDVSRIFGEALTYLEVDYRGVEFTLPFSGRTAVLPKNLIVIATANPYDRSVTDLDDALLRRFWVIELEPDEAFLRSYLQEQAVEPGVVSRTVQLFSILNRNFPNGFGHTNFLKVKTVDDLAAVWLGRVRLGLRRALTHDRITFEATSAEIDALLRTIADIPPVVENPAA